MALIQTFEKEGNFLFKYRGQFPAILFLIAIPFISTTDYFLISDSGEKIYTIISFSLSFLGFLIRSYTIGTTPKGTSGRNTKQQVAEVLNSTGVYSTLRHPLYLGNYLIWIGIAAYSFNVVFIIIVSLIFWLFYERIMFAEERFLEKKFGDEYLDWSNNIPAFIPNLSNFQRSNIRFSFITVLRREYSGFLACVIGFCFVEVLKNNKMGQELFSDRMLYALGITLAVSCVLRILKRKTNLLNEANRS
ncbi:MAG: isoprenylcysteine carboxylmethyltransferase family protein [Bacteroidota bacterium]|nr:isoprenylcysteine carboxylmethyltransferase family protein [Bacteroidota bacterium]